MCADISDSVKVVKILVNNDMHFQKSWDLIKSDPALLALCIDQDHFRDIWFSRVWDLFFDFVDSAFPDSSITEVEFNLPFSVS